MAKLYFRYGVMNSGKSVALMQVAHNYHERGMRAIIVKPEVDTKAGIKVSSRIGISKTVDALIGQHDNVFEVIDEVIKEHSAACVLIDEVHFLTPAHIDQLFELSQKANIPVICYGLRTDFKFKSFPASARLLAIAHTIEELKTVCACGKKAVHNVRLLEGSYICLLYTSDAADDLTRVAI